jgi:hypothetical protein
LLLAVSSNIPWEIGTQGLSPHSVSLLGGDHLDVRGELGGYATGAVPPRPDVALADAFTRAGGQLAGENRLAARDFNSSV